MTLAEVVRENPRLAANVPDVLEGLAPYLAAAPNARIHWVEEYFRAEIHDATHRAGIAALTASGLVLTWRHGLLWRQRATFELTRDAVTAWRFDHGDRLSARTVDGPVSIQFRAGSPEFHGFSERLRLIRPLGPETR